MTQIADLPFTQYVNLNILNEFRIQGVLVTPASASFRATEITTAYTADILDDGIVATGTFNINLFASSLAQSLITIKSISPGGTVTVVPDGSETIDGASTHVLTAGTAITIMPITGGWTIV